MELTFERGDPQRPRGHAVVYFRVDTEPDRVYATYIITLPVKADLAKYVPPFLASHLGGLPLNDLSAFAMPPLPEVVESHRALERLCEWREDDLVYATSMFSFDLPRMMEAVSEAVQAYSQLCARRFAAPGQATGENRERELAEDRSYQVNEVLFSLMSESDKLAELARLLGKLRFAVEGRDSGTVEDVSEEIATLARHLPEDYQVAALLAAAKDTSRRASRLAQLYLDRCFRLSAGDVSRVQVLEQEIRKLQRQG